MTLEERIIQYILFLCAMAEKNLYGCTDSMILHYSNDSMTGGYFQSCGGKSDK